MHIVKSQTATEYLIILAVVIVVSLTVISLLGDIPSNFSEVQTIVASAQLRSQDIGIINYFVGSNHSFLTLQNNRNFPVQIKNISVGEAVCLNLPINLEVGEQKKIICYGVNAIVDTNYNYNYIIEWVDLNTGSIFTQDNPNLFLSGNVIENRKKVMYFNGIDTRIDLDSRINLIDDFEIRFTILAEDFQTNPHLRRIISKNNNKDSIYLSSSGGIGFRIDSSNLLNSNPQLTLNEKYTVRVTRTNGLVEMYINEVESLTTVTHSGVFSIDRFGFGSTSHFQGLLYNISIYNNGTLISYYGGYGNTNDEWVDQIGFNNGNVIGEPMIVYIDP